STHGIGRATALTFAAEGAAVVVTGRDETAGAEVMERTAEIGGRGIFVRADLQDPDVGTIILQAVTRAFGAPTVLVNNAGSSDLVRDGTDRAISEIEDESWDRLLTVN